MTLDKKAITSRWTGKSPFFGFPMYLYLEVSDLRKEDPNLSREQAKDYLINKYSKSLSTDIFDTVLNFVYRDQHQEESPTDFKP